VELVVYLCSGQLSYACVAREWRPRLVLRNFDHIPAFGVDLASKPVSMHL
jgi:hypothetical protein